MDKYIYGDQQFGIGPKNILSLETGDVRARSEGSWMNVILIITVKNSDVLKCKSAIEPLDDLMFEI